MSFSMIYFGEGKYIIEESDLRKLLEDTAIKAIAEYDKQKSSKKFVPEGCMSRQDLIGLIGKGRVERYSEQGIITKIKNGKNNSKVFFSIQELKMQGVIPESYK